MGQIASNPPAEDKIPLSDADNGARFNIPESGEGLFRELPPLPELEKEVNDDRGPAAGSTSGLLNDEFWQQELAILELVPADHRAFRDVSEEMLDQALIQAYGEKTNPTRTDYQQESGKGGKRGTYRCRVCGIPGHNRATCPVLRTRGATGSSDHHCSYCKTKGHNFATCPTKPPGLEPMHRQKQKSRQEKNRALKEGGQPASFCSLAVH